jgi:hypothetical protein
MSRSRRDHGRIGVLALALLTQPACLYSSLGTTRDGPKKLTLGAPQLTQLASRVDVERHGEAFYAVATPMCAEVKTGTLVVAKEEVRRKTSTVGRSLTMFALGAGALIGGYYALGTSLEPLAYTSIGFGALAVPWGLAALALPRTLSSREPEQSYAATVFNPRTLTPCGTPKVVDVPLEFRIRGGGESGTQSEPPVDVDTWAGACNVDVTFAVTLEKNDDVVYEEAGLWKSRAPEPYSTSAIPSTYELPKLFPTQVTNADRIELGTSKSGALYAAKYRWEFPIVPSKSAPTGDSRASTLARACLDEKREANDKATADAREKCRAPKRAAIRATCRPTCVSPLKSESCKLSFDLCNDGIANIGGSARQQCEAAQDRCLEDVGQTPAAIESCISACEDKAFAPVCR